MNKTKKEKPVQLYGIFGYPLSHTLSPGMQEAAFSASGIKAFYLVLEQRPEDFRKTASGLKKSLLEGFNVTVPYKQVILPYLDQLTPEARAVGAVNTVFKKAGQWTGTNTDVYGFLTSLRKDGGVNPRNKKALVLGAGGAARAVVTALAGSGAQAVWVANRSEKRARLLAKEFKKIFPKIPVTAIGLKEVPDALVQADLVVNATSAGLKPGERILNDSVIPAAKNRKKLFYDLIYHRGETEFLNSARKKGHNTLDGLGMLLHQGAKAFEHWTGKKAPVPVMKKALLAGLEARKRH